MKARKNPEHWTEQPRRDGKFSTDGEPTHPSIVGFKLPQSLYERLEKEAHDRGISVNLLVKEFVMKNIAQYLGNNELTRL